MKISILIPWRTDGPDGHRQKVWDFLQPLWDQSGFEICVGEDDVFSDRPPYNWPDPDYIPGNDTRYFLPFNCSMALNRAAAQATGDVFVCMGADHYPDPDAIHVAAAMTAYPPYWTPTFGSMAYLSEEYTEALIAGRTTIERCPIAAVDPTAHGNSAVARGAWEAVGGMDQRYSGWGWEDSDLIRRLSRKNGVKRPPFTRGLSLWHKTAHRDLSFNNPNRRLFESGS